MMTEYTHRSRGAGSTIAGDRQKNRGTFQELDPVAEILISCKPFQGSDHRRPPILAPTFRSNTIRLNPKLVPFAESRPNNWEWSKRSLEHEAK